MAAVAIWADYPPARRLVWGRSAAARCRVRFSSGGGGRLRLSLGIARVRWLRRRPGAALTVDRYDEDWSRLAWVQALGQVSIEENAPEDVLEALVAKYRQYEDEAPGGPFIGLEPRRFVHWRAGGED